MPQHQRREEDSNLRKLLLQSIDHSDTSPENAEGQSGSLRTHHQTTSPVSFCKVENPVLTRNHADPQSAALPLELFSTFNVRDIRSAVLTRTNLPRNRMTAEDETDPNNPIFADDNTGSATSAACFAGKMLPDLNRHLPRWWMCFLAPSI